MNLPSDNNNHVDRVEPAKVGSLQGGYQPGLGHTDLSEGNSLAKVRDILFGNQMRELDSRFARLEERLAKECTSLREETRKRLDYLEEYIKQEVGSIAERLKNEQTGREGALQNLTEEYRNITNNLEKKIVYLDEQTSTHQRELREQILNQSKTLHDDIHQKYEEILNLLEKELKEIRTSKTDRSNLASLFTEVALRLNSQQ